MADPISVLSMLWTASVWLYDQAQNAKDNREECERLASHAKLLHESISSKYPDNRQLPKELENLLETLSSALDDVRNSLTQIETQSLWKRIFFSQDVTASIEKAKTCLKEAIDRFQVSSQIDILRLLHDFEDARKRDAARLARQIREFQGNDEEILKFFQVRPKEIAEALNIIKSKETSPGSLEYQIREKFLPTIERYAKGAKLPSSIPLIPSGEIIFNRNQKLGSGSFGSVYEGLWKGRIVAIKLLDSVISHEMLVADLEALSNLDHRRILQLFGVSAPDAERQFLVVCRRENNNVMQYLEKNRNADRRRLLHEASCGLLYLHKRNIIHGNLRGANILIGGYGHACLSDFGLSTVKSITNARRQSAQSNVGASHAIGGNHPFASYLLQWMSPEQITVGPVVGMNKMSDVYSFGMTMYEVYIGGPPLGSEPNTKVFQMVALHGHRPSRPTPSTSSITSCSIDDEIWHMIELAWAQDPTRRPETKKLVESLKTPSSQKSKVAVEQKSKKSAEGAPTGKQDNSTSIQKFKSPTSSVKATPRVGGAVKDRRREGGDKKDEGGKRVGAGAREAVAKKGEGPKEATSKKDEGKRIDQGKVVNGKIKASKNQDWKKEVRDRGKDVEELPAPKPAGQDEKRTKKPSSKPQEQPTSSLKKSKSAETLGVKKSQLSSSRDRTPDARRPSSAQDARSRDERPTGTQRASDQKKSNGEHTNRHTSHVLLQPTDATVMKNRDRRSSDQALPGRMRSSSSEGARHRERERPRSTSFLPEA